MDSIYVVRGTEQAGPFTENEIRAQLASGELTGDSMVWWDGLAEWTPISRTPLGAPAAIAPAAPTPLAVPAPATISPKATSVTVPAAALAEPSVKKTSTLAIISLVLGILGILCAPLIGTGAVITGHMARGEIRKNPSLSGGGMALAGLVLGYLWLALFVVGIIADIFLFSTGHMKDVFSTIQSQIQAEQTTNNAPSQ